MNDLSVSAWLERDEVSEIAAEMQPLRQWQRTFSATKRAYAPSKEIATTSPDILMSMRLTYAAHMLRTLVEIDSERMDGVPVLVGTRFTVARIIAEIADGMSVAKLAREFDLNKDHIVELLHGIATQLDKPFG